MADTKSKYVTLFYHLDSVDAVQTDNRRKEALGKAAQWWRKQDPSDIRLEVWKVGEGLVASSARGDFDTDKEEEGNEEGL